MKKISVPAILAVLILGPAAASQPAFAQASPSGNMQAPPLQPKPAGGDEPLPPAVPGIGDQGLSAVPSVAKPQTGDPTVQLFTAINANNYSLAQDAISRGADLNGQNALGESPIDLSVSLNRNSITFMLLAARNASGDDPDATAPAPATAAARYSPPAGHAARAAMPAKGVAIPRAVPEADPGTPNPGAGFLGFGK